ncbi:MAG: ABC transporter permease subunit [Acetobacteraceae bacterium]
MPYDPAIIAQPINSIIGGASLWTMTAPNRPAAEYKGTAEFLAFLAQPANAAAWHQNTGYVPVTLAGYELSKQQGYYDKNPGTELPIQQLTRGKVTDNSRGLRLGGCRKSATSCRKRSRRRCRASNRPGGAGQLGGARQSRSARVREVRPDLRVEAGRRGLPSAQPASGLERAARRDPPSALSLGPAHETVDISRLAAASSAGGAAVAADLRLLPAAGGRGGLVQPDANRPVRAVQRVRGPGQFRRPVQRPALRDSIWRTIGFVFAVCVLSMGAGTVPRGVRRPGKSAGAAFYRTMLIWPYAVAPAISAVIWLFLMHPQIGLISRLINGAGLHWDYSLNGFQAMTLVILASAWKQVSYNFIFFVAGLGSIPRSVTEAARMDGARGWRRFRTITLPLLMPTTFS